MKIGVITIGNELLMGQTLNSNLYEIGKIFSKMGVSIKKSSTICDEEKAIVETLDSYMKEFDLILITGGLGPTNDDITKEVLAQYFDTELVLNERVLEWVQDIFESKGKEMLPSNILQAMLPKSAAILDNPLGTAPGMWFTKGDKTVISLPGVPYEMIELLQNEVVPRLKEKFKLEGIYFQTLMVQGIGESFLAKEIAEWERRIYKEGLHLAYLPSPGIIRLRLTSDKGKVDAQLIEDYFKELKVMLPQYVYGVNDESIFEVVGNLLKERKKTLGTIESCTGGGLSNSFISFPGASLFFKGGLITYSNELKTKLANVSPATLEKHGAVSEEIALEMAVNGREILDADYAISVTGVAGPDGGSKEKPVGLVWIAVASSQGVSAQKFLFGDNRLRNIERSMLSAANMLRQMILYP